MPKRGQGQVLLSKSECRSAHSYAREGFSHLRIIAVSRRVGREDAEKGGLESESASGEMFSVLAFLSGSVGIYQSRC